MSSLEPIPLSVYQAAIVTECACAVQIAIKDYTVPRIIFLEQYVVKFNNQDILNEGDTLAFVYAALKGSPNAPRVPEIHECFSWDGIQYLVMERVDLPTVESWINNAASEAETQSRFDIACRSVADALSWLFTLSPPDGAEIGLIKGAYAQTQSPHVCARSGRSYHRFFGGGFSAPHRYTGAPALHRHINKALRQYTPRRAPLPVVEISDEPLVMVQGDIRPRNFLIDPETQRVTLIDFGCVCALPRSFVSYTLHVAGDKFITNIDKYLSWERSENLSAMAAAQGLFCMMASKSLGLDADGYPVPPVPKVVSRWRPTSSEPSVKM
ncbi:hypothetical protein FA95DRAFT_1682965 [Auriscalpium vulgare]|uniref:Uncharacterized protein n=1 Tax=Auriscalpium vulgare TaxID=40419 RepID=A0ACB8RC99_9AGAM|nr:hypothetical protein FA95DRAFT_1682965 [Auriscalpium vulgare]